MSININVKVDNKKLLEEVRLQQKASRQAQLEKEANNNLSTEAEINRVNRLAAQGKDANGNPVTTPQSRAPGIGRRPTAYRASGDQLSHVYFNIAYSGNTRIYTIKNRSGDTLTKEIVPDIETVESYIGTNPAPPDFPDAVGSNFGSLIPGPKHPVSAYELNSVTTLSDRVIWNYVRPANDGVNRNYWNSCSTTNPASEFFVPGRNSGDGGYGGLGTRTDMYRSFFSSYASNIAFVLPVKKDVSIFVFGVIVRTTSGYITKSFFETTGFVENGSFTLAVNSKTYVHATIPEKIVGQFSACLVSAEGIREIPVGQQLQDRIVDAVTPSYSPLVDINIDRTLYIDRRTQIPGSAFPPPYQCINSSLTTGTIGTYQQYETNNPAHREAVAFYHKNALNCNFADFTTYQDYDYINSTPGTSFYSPSIYYYLQITGGEIDRPNSAEFSDVYPTPIPIDEWRQTLQGQSITLPNKTYSFYREFEDPQTLESKYQYAIWSGPTPAGAGYGVNQGSIPESELLLGWNNEIDDPDVEDFYALKTRLDAPIESTGYRVYRCWDWANPGYCRQQALAFGFASADLAP